MTGHWLAYNRETGEYTIAGGSGAAGGAAASLEVPASADVAKAGSVSTAAQSAIAATEAILSDRAAAPVVSASATAGSEVKKRSAVIGAAPQLSSVGLMAAVQQLEERELQQRALAKQKEEDQKKTLQANAAPTVPIGPMQGVIH